MTNSLNLLGIALIRCFLIPVEFIFLLTRCCLRDSDQSIRQYQSDFEFSLVQSRLKKWSSQGNSFLVSENM